MLSPRQETDRRQTQPPMRLCAECNQPIDAARLRAVGNASLCADCATSEAHVPAHTD